jgi:hypothetical protein
LKHIVEKCKNLRLLTVKSSKITGKIFEEARNESFIPKIEKIVCEGVSQNMLM